MFDFEKQFADRIAAVIHKNQVLYYKPVSESEDY